MWVSQSHLKLMGKFGEEINQIFVLIIQIYLSHDWKQETVIWAQKWSMYSSCLGDSEFDPAVFPYRCRCRSFLRRWEECFGCRSEGIPLMSSRLWSDLLRHEDGVLELQPRLWPCNCSILQSAAAAKMERLKVSSHSASPQTRILLSLLLLKPIFNIPYIFKLIG